MLQADHTDKKNSVQENMSAPVGVDGAVGVPRAL